MSASVESAAFGPKSSRLTEFPGRRTISLVPSVQLPPVNHPAGAADTAPFLAPPMLTQREIQVLTGWIHCDSKPAVAKSLFLSLGTVNTHLTRIRAKYAAAGRPAGTKASLVARALQDGLIDIADL
ncbi:helix-turn-helix transcriptional regulator [Rhodococcus sp. G-MC3]|uniref:response regulator transcription factor n=1 Tax=Rhodococcus sp. G-MC3 TaxID=3046209 RepID=UPI0024BB5C87|nr:helix-turn-helix transcriptional regulator [Rhodococcus sp. G-MC3]MDJ0393630.1 helix-turn-helix transcriptional regulator [Rhodococcus sp. G-MC3]